MIEIKKILFPCDLEESSSKILPYVLSVSEKYNSMIYFLHVIKELPLWGYYDIPYAMVTDLQNRTLEVSEKTIDKICEEQMKECQNLQKRITVGNPSNEILSTIESEKIDLVIMGTHGRKGFDHAIFGSVAEKVMKKSPVPVLIINTFKDK
jgi:nucleotide-binding universal stress UspA family protein